MSRRRFLVEGFGDRRAVVEGEQGHHLARVLRARRGQVYELSDGAEVWLGRVESVHSERVEFDLVEQVQSPSAMPQFSLLVSVIKFDRFEWILEKAAEFGVTSLTPVSAARSDKRLLEAAAGRAARWRKILLNASQQARRLAPPLLAELTGPAEAFARAEGGAKLLLSESREAPLLRNHLSSDGSLAGCVVLALGPQGGWTAEETEAARGAGFAEVSLGDTVLRAETACLAALAILSHELAAAARAGQ